MRVKTLKPHIYASRRRHVGDEYEMQSKSDLRLFKALGRIEEVPAVVDYVTEIHTSYLTRHLEAEPAEKPKRKYTRRKKVEE